MAKIILNSTTGAKIHGINPICEGTKLLFVSELNKGNFVATYQKDDETKSGIGLCAVALFGGVLRPVILQYRSVWGVSVAPIKTDDSTEVRVPQMKHSASKQLCTLGSEAINDIAKGRKVLEVTKLYSGTFRKRKSNDTYTWDILGIDNTTETFSVKDGKISIGGQELGDVTELQTLYNDLQERETQRVAEL